VSPAPTIEEIWRYPVKSLRGELLDRSIVTERGLLGDRLWAVADSASGKLGSGKDTRRFRRFPGTPLLDFAARYSEEPTGEDAVSPPIVTAPDGTEFPVMDGVADVLFQQHSELATLTVAREADIDHFDEGPVSLISRATLAWMGEQLPSARVDARRFRPNLVVGGVPALGEESWCGRRIRIGEGVDSVELTVDHVLERCVMVNSAQADLEYEPRVLKLLGRRVDQPARLAVLAWVVKAGIVRTGDRVGEAD
jgi:uncharacterized protein YcbX